MDFLHSLDDASRWLIGLLLAVLVVWLAHRLALSRDLSTAKRNALQAFRDAFQPEINLLSQLRPREHGNTYEMLREVYPRHLAAYEALKPYLGLIGQWRLNRKWIAYRGKPPNSPQLPEEDEFYRLGHFIANDSRDEQAQAAHALSLIKKLTS